MNSPFSYLPGQNMPFILDKIWRDMISRQQGPGSPAGLPLPFTMPGALGKQTQTQTAGPPGPQQATAMSQGRYNQALLNKFLSGNKGVMQLLQMMNTRQQPGALPVGQKPR